MALKRDDNPYPRPRPKPQPTSIAFSPQPHPSTDRKKASTPGGRSAQRRAILSSSSHQLHYTRPCSSDPHHHLPRPPSIHPSQHQSRSRTSPSSSTSPVDELSPNLAISSSYRVDPGPRGSEAGEEPPSEPGVPIRDSRSPWERRGIWEGVAKSCGERLLRRSRGGRGAELACRRDSIIH
ncbi:hypothetical protein FA13DRAFT_162684 [Coprinellus micaceus]|uniref:Uncharacterized protein n=1 Tax=Coprinellus micaceus TaxID=71717 RepID=A0A4Y7THE2_COPMI|nr:hypothetical protein FA13DRAFT_162684 [Coprinellus micaceus]